MKARRTLIAERDRALVAHEALTIQRDRARRQRDAARADAAVLSAALAEALACVDAERDRCTAEHGDLLRRCIVLAHRVEQAEARAAAAVERECVLAAELRRRGVDVAAVLLVVDRAGAREATDG